MIAIIVDVACAIVNILLVEPCTLFDHRQINVAFFALKISLLEIVFPKVVSLVLYP